MALLQVATDNGEVICTFIIPAETGWGEHLERQLAGVINALQDAVDKDAKTYGVER